ncbi:hypothetical protein [Hymenobacter tenuis]
MKYNATLSLLLALTLVFTASCNTDREDTPEPTPELAITYSRSIVYQDNGQRRDTTFQAKQLKAYATLSAQSLVVGVQPITTTEGIGFILERSTVPASLTKVYTLQTLSNRTLDADVTYFQDLPESLGGATIMYFSSMQHITGNLTISRYDATRQLVSGTYSATLTGSNDPVISYITFPKRKCDITITGSFTNVPLKQIE